LGGIGSIHINKTFPKSSPPLTLLLPSPYPSKLPLPPKGRVRGGVRGVAYPFGLLLLFLEGRGGEGRGGNFPQPKYAATFPFQVAPKGRVRGEGGVGNKVNYSIDSNKDLTNLIRKKRI